MRSRLRWLGEQAGWLLGIVGCLLLMLILLPLIPILELYDDVRRAYEDKQRGRPLVSLASGLP